MREQYLKISILSFWQMYKYRYNKITDRKYLQEFAEISVTLAFQIFFQECQKKKKKPTPTVFNK